MIVLFGHSFGFMEAYISSTLLSLKSPMVKMDHFACDWAHSFCTELGRSTRDRLLHDGMRRAALSTRILQLYRLTQCGDLGG